MQDALLSVENLRVSFASDGQWMPVVHDVSFTIESGTTVAIVGESGSGKSVTSLALIRLLPPDSSRIEGSIRFAGTPLNELDNKAMRRMRANEIAMIFQEPMTSLNPSLTIGYQLAEVLITHRGMGQREAQAEAVR